MGRRRRRLLRILLNAATVTSLVMCVPTPFFWTRSYTHLDQYGAWPGPGHRYVLVASLRGGLQIATVDLMPDPLEGGRWTVGWASTRFDARTWLSPPPGDDFQLFRGPGTEPAAWLGFRLLTGKFGTAKVWSARVPFWCLALVTTTAPCLMFAQRLRRASRRRAGLCPSCGYDVRATPDRCPECGRRAEGAAD